MTLLQELERATEGSRELDAKIAEAIGWCFVPAHTLSEAKWLPPAWSDPQTDPDYSAPPAFSTSLDAARTLVPEGMWMAAEMGAGGHENWWTWFVGKEQASAPTAALALCIAALKAIEHEKAKDSVTSS